MNTLRMVPPDEQRAQVANKMYFDLHMGLRGILGPDVNDPLKRAAAAAEVMTVLQQLIQQGA